MAGSFSRTIFILAARINHGGIVLLDSRYGRMNLSKYGVIELFKMCCLLRHGIDQVGGQLKVDDDMTKMLLRKVWLISRLKSPSSVMVHVT
jgi:hypothetical protein